MSAGQGQSGGAEQRRYARVPINLDGYIAIGNGAPVPCTVRDFCYGGMFISADAATYASAAPEMPATLYFALMVGGVKQDYQIQLIIARAIATGIGVAFRDADDQALQLLGQLAAPTGMPETDSSRAAATLAEPAAAEAFARVKKPLQALAVEHVSRIAKRFIQKADDALFLAARDADNNVAQNRLLDGQREMRGRHKRILDEVVPKIEHGVAILGNPLESAPKDPSSIGLSDLSLVEKDEFEEFLAISELVSELEPEFSEALFQLGRRISHLANRDVGASNNPIGPSVLCNAVAESLKGLQSDRWVTVIVYRVLREVMSNELGAFYQAANALLIEHGVLPVIEKDKPQLKRPPSEDKDFDAPVADDLADTAAQFSPPQEENLAESMPGPESYQGRGAAGAPTAPPPADGQSRFEPPPGPQNAAPSERSAAAGGAPPGPGGHVRAAAPSMPVHRGVQAAPPSLPVHGGVQAAPPTLPARGGVRAAPPTLPGQGGVQAAAPTLPGGAGEQPAADLAASGDWAAVSGGWTGAPIRHAMPTLERAYSTAQAQLSLRRQLAPAAPVAAGEATPAAYSMTQIVSGLAALQREFADGRGERLGVEALEERITRALMGEGEPRLGLDRQATDALEVVAGLFGALLEDALVAKSAKDHLTRLQPVVHRAALIDEGFFERADHPVRLVVDRIARLRDGKSEGQQQRHARVGELVSEANREFREDVGLFDDVLDELDQILDEQESEYQTRVHDVVHACEEQQRVLEARRGQSLETTDGNAERSDLPEEWNKWLERSRKLEVGARMLMNATSANPVAATLVWKEARGNLFVFADDQGSKASTLTQQQVAMYLRRGILRPLDDQAGSALERAMFGVVDRFHRQVEDQATRDPLTGFLQRRFFVEEIDAVLSDVEPESTRHVAVCLIDIDNLREINDDHGDAVGDALLAAFAAELSQLIRDKGVVFGRLGGATLGVYWPAGGIQGSYKRLQAAVESLRAVSVSCEAPSTAETATAAAPDPNATVEQVRDPDEATVAGRVGANFVIGLSGSEDGLIQAEGLLQAAREACETAREMGDGSIYVAGAENVDRRRLEQLVAYVEQTLEHNCLVLAGQHVSSLADGALRPALHIAVSATDRNGKLIPPHVFAPALARASNAHDIDLWVFRQTLKWLQDNESALEEYALVIIPLSAASVRNDELPNLIMTEFMETPVPPGRICFGLADHDVVDNVIGVGDLIGTLKEFGCRFVLDEFGSGHANYDYIKTIAIDYVTIRSGFVADASRSPKDFAMAKSINELVHFMGKKTVAKQTPGVDLGDTMREIGIDFLHDQTERVRLVGAGA
ncbi:MAG: DUF1631 family protein [Gammaproteobacteria bacterium]